MASYRPLVLIDGKIHVLPWGDPGVAIYRPLVLIGGEIKVLPLGDEADISDGLPATELRQSTTLSEQIAVTGARTISITPQQTGSLLVLTGAATLGAGLQSIASVSDNVDGAWTVVSKAPATDVSTNNITAFIAYKTCSSTAARTVTITPGNTTSATYWAMGCTEVYKSGMTFSGDNHAETTVTAASNTVTSSNVTPSVVKTITFAVSGGYSASPTWTAPISPWVSVYSSLNTSNVQLNVVYQIDTGTIDTFAPAFTLSGGAAAGSVPSCVVHSFKYA